MNSEPLYNIDAIYRITNSEYDVLSKKLDSYAKWAAWRLIKRNTKTSHTDDWEDVYQRVLWAIVRAGAYYKRQTYIEKCFILLNEYTEDEFTKMVINELEDLWKSRKRHGANKQKFGFFQENLLDKMVKSFVPKEFQPNKNSLLVFNKEFDKYCKSIICNELRSLGKSISKEKPFRDVFVSLDKFDFIMS